MIRPKRHRSFLLASFIGVSFGCALAWSQMVYADEVSLADVGAEQLITEKKQQIDGISQKIEAFQKQIEQKEQEAVSLANEIDLLENREEQTRLRIEEIRAQIDLLQMQMSQLQMNIVRSEQKIARESELMTTVIQRIQSEDQTIPLELFYGSDSFSTLLDTVQRLMQVNGDLTRATQETKKLKENLAEQQNQVRAQTESLARSEEELQKISNTLQEQQEAKQTLLTVTKNSEKQFQTLVKELEQEQALVRKQIQDLQSSLASKLSPLAQSDNGLFAWPLPASFKRVSATFHDPTYPFRNLFEHPGIDLPAPVGTPIYSAAPGYVAWTKRGSQYGNYVMIIHANGLATLYAHMSRIDVVADQFVPRGGQVGLVGMTGLTTGPHLHFEVRKDGLPIDPAPFIFQ